MRLPPLAAFLCRFFGQIVTFDLVLLDVFLASVFQTLIVNRSKSVARHALGILHCDTPKRLSFHLRRKKAAQVPPSPVQE